jgi:hypothetical protein
MCRMKCTIIMDLVDMWGGVGGEDLKSMYMTQDGSRNVRLLS